MSVEEKIKQIFELAVSNGIPIGHLALVREEGLSVVEELDGKLEATTQLIKNSLRPICDMNPSVEFCIQCKECNIGERLALLEMEAEQK